MFPPLNKDRLVEPHDDFNSFLYWRTDIPIIDDNEQIQNEQSIDCDDEIIVTEMIDHQYYQPKQQQQQ